jgi:hypothetical protein
LKPFFEPAGAAATFSCDMIASFMAMTAVQRRYASRLEL